MINVCILDDNVVEASHHKELLIQYFHQCDIDYDRIDVFSSGKQLLNTPKAYDFLFLDIEIGEENGIEIAKELRKRDQEMLIIVISSYVKYSMDGYKINAARYLLKPLDASLLYSELDELFKTSFLQQSILLQGEGNQLRLAINDIYYFEAYGRQTRFCTMQHQYIASNSVGSWAIKLPSTFVECYKGLYVHLRYIQSIHKDQMVLENGQVLPLARRRNENIKKLWVEFQGLII